ncbi:MAG: HAD hydrolase family protein [Lachnospiraceae bacterium]|nr:HAD hydrolase family protein [Lachnospiraceae bacterium]MDE6979834.1 HAD hydrolase family protein [Lachnospiraceae bacterium]
MKVKYFVMDVDGTLTDGKIYMGAEGEMFKAFDIKDGCGIHNLLIPSGVTPVIITGRSSRILENRCRELGISEVYQGVENKTEKLEELLSKARCKYDHVAYIGDDINDLPCMEVIKGAGGLVGCPTDAAKEVKAIADFISVRCGGSGAVREFIEWILEHQEGTYEF